MKSSPDKSGRDSNPTNSGQVLTIKINFIQMKYGFKAIRIILY
jgi:hypothetical protein